MELKIINDLVPITILLFIFVANAAAKNEIPDPISFESEIDQIGNKVTLWFYSRNNRDKPIQIYVGQVKSYDESPYSTDRETVFITHGWQSSNESDACVNVKNGFLHRADYNVFVVDWSEIAGNKNFGAAAARVKAVANYVSQHINFLVGRGTKPDNIHLVGHSLGAHVMGLAGYLAKNKVAHVVGLDPASPGFENQKPDGRISTQSGKYVEVIHTCAGILGIKKAVGHVDYYPNGGTVMPGCEVDTTGSCSHGRAYYYYEESMKDPQSWYVRICASWEEFLLGNCNGNKMFQFARWTARGIKRDLNKRYYLRTNSESPYGLGEPGTRPEDNTTKELTASEEYREYLRGR